MSESTRDAFRRTWTIEDEARLLRKSRPPGVRGPGGRKRKRVGWSERAERTLLREVRDAPGPAERQVVLEARARKRDISVAGVKSKFALLQRAADERESATMKTTVTATGVGSQAAPPQPAAPSRPTPSTQKSSGSGSIDPLVTYTMVELADLGMRVSAELKRRVISLQEMWA